MALTFPRKVCSWDVDRLTVTFRGEADGREVVCAISVEALQDHFGLKGADGRKAMDAFIANRSTIEDRAILLFAGRLLEPDGSIMVRTRDFR